MDHQEREHTSRWKAAKQRTARTRGSPSRFRRLQAALRRRSALRAFPARRGQKQFHSPAGCQRQYARTRPETPSSVLPFTATPWLWPSWPTEAPTRDVQPDGTTTKSAMAMNAMMVFIISHSQRVAGLRVSKFAGSPGTLPSSLADQQAHSRCDCQSRRHEAELSQRDSKYADDSDENQVNGEQQHSDVLFHVGGVGWIFSCPET